MQLTAIYLLLTSLIPCQVYFGDLKCQIHFEQADSPLHRVSQFHSSGLEISIELLVHCPIRDKRKIAWHSHFEGHAIESSTWSLNSHFARSDSWSPAIDIERNDQSPHLFKGMLSLIANANLKGMHSLLQEPWFSEENLAGMANKVRGLSIDVI